MSILPALPVAPVAPLESCPLWLCFLLLSAPLASSVCFCMSELFWVSEFFFLLSELLFMSELFCFVPDPVSSGNWLAVPGRPRSRPLYPSAPHQQRRRPE